MARTRVRLKWKDRVKATPSTEDVERRCVTCNNVAPRVHRCKPKPNWKGNLRSLA